MFVIVDGMITDVNFVQLSIAQSLIMVTDFPPSRSGITIVPDVLVEIARVPALPLPTFTQSFSTK